MNAMQSDTANHTIVALFAPHAKYGSLATHLSPPQSQLVRNTITTDPATLKSADNYKRMHVACPIIDQYTFTDS